MTNVYQDVLREHHCTPPQAGACVDARSLFRQRKIRGAWWKSNVEL
jgi:hypothetical protein